MFQPRPPPSSADGNPSLAGSVLATLLDRVETEGGTIASHPLSLSRKRSPLPVSCLLGVTEEIGEGVTAAPTIPPSPFNGVLALFLSLFLHGRPDGQHALQGHTVAWR
jgi:hypothetical protein